MKKKQKTEFQKWESTMKKLENKMAKEEEQRKGKKVIQEVANVLLIGIIGNAPFWAYFMGWI